MDLHFNDLLRSLVGLSAGALIGYAFGLIQNAALLRHQRLQKEGKFKSGWSVMPGSGRRVAYLLLALVVVQLVCPLLFVDGLQWLVSLGVAGGYGSMLYLQMRRRLRSAV